MNPLVIAATMARRGMLAPNLPHRLVGQLTSLATWGMSLVGEVRQASEREGKVFVNGELWNAEAEEKIEPGDKVEVVEVHNLKLKVEKIGGR